jgi:hypothetical protein
MPSNTMWVYWMLSLEDSPKLQQISPLQQFSRFGYFNAKNYLYFELKSTHQNKYGLSQI